ncbi:nucleotide exchange factor GrpE [Zhouia sp. PK063]|uniref:nucleotide exchange factor GrpE n=1 Tax=Zhouia sp. PK063 TaxID=3373602 RepID=UPI00379F4A99
MSTKDKNENIAEEQEKDIQQEQQTEAQQELSVEEKLAEDLAKEKDKFLRLFAEFENYKKRTSKERSELFKTANQEVLGVMLPVLDDFDRALQQMVSAEDKELVKGVELISNKLRNTLKNKGLEEIEVKQGDAFDAEIHEAITQIPAPTEDLKGKIIDVVEKGYKLSEKVLRHPKVVVGQQ